MDRRVRSGEILVGRERENRFDSLATDNGVLFGQLSVRVGIGTAERQLRVPTQKIVAEALKGIGNGGGHASMAGGFVPCTGSDMDVKLLEAQMKERFLAVIADVKKRAV